MPDDPPVSTTVPETVTVDTGADQKTIGDLNKEFQDFWNEQDTGEPSSAPPAPEAGAAQETPPPKPKEEPKAKEPAPVIKPKEETKSFSDDEVEKLALPTRAGQPSEMQADFKQIKDFWKADRARLKQIEAEKAQLVSELQQARSNAFTPEQKADYEHAAAVRRKFDFVSDPDFIQKHQQPIMDRFNTVLEETIAVLPDRNAAQAWADHIRQNYSPDQLSRQWWLKSVVEKVPDPLERQALLGSVTELLKMQRDRDTEVHTRSSDKSAFDNWIQEKTKNTAERVQQEIMAEIGEQEKRIQEVLPRDIESAKTAEERAAIQAHNERFTQLNKHFVDQMQDLSKNGPRAWVRASVEATRAIMLEEQSRQLQEELDSTKAERDQLRTQLDKIAGARRKLATTTTGTPPATAAKRDGNGLSVKNLDVRKSFQSFWDEQDRNP